MVDIMMILVLSFFTRVSGQTCGGVHKNIEGEKVAKEAQSLAKQLMKEHDLSAWINSNGTYGGQNDYDYVAVVPGPRGTDGIEPLVKLQDGKPLIPDIKLQDGPAGVRNVLSCCDGEKVLHSYPAPASIGASWSPDFAYHHTRFAGPDWARVGANAALTPGVGVHRLPIFGRNWEYVSGEDAALGSLVGDMVKGVQSANVLPAVKHWAFNHQELNRGTGGDSRDGNIAIIDEEVAMETYLRAYQHAIDVGAGGFMCGYNQVQFYRNGVTDGSHAFVCGSEALSTLLRKDMGFGGLMMSDWNAYFQNTSKDAKSHSGREFSDWEMRWDPYDENQAGQTDKQTHQGIQYTFNPEDAQGLFQKKEQDKEKEGEGEPKTGKNTDRRLPEIEEDSEVGEEEWPMDEEETEKKQTLSAAALALGHALGHGVTTAAEIKKKELVAIERTLAGLYLSGVIESKNGKAPGPAPPAAKTLPQVYAKTMAGNPDIAEDGDAFEVQLVAESLVLLKNGKAAKKKTAKNEQNEAVLETVLPIPRSETKIYILLIGEAMLAGGGSGEAPPFAWWYRQQPPQKQMKKDIDDKKVELKARLEVLAAMPNKYRAHSDKKKVEDTDDDAQMLRKHAEEEEQNVEKLQKEIKELEKTYDPVGEAKSHNGGSRARDLMTKHLGEELNAEVVWDRDLISPHFDKHAKHGLHHKDIPGTAKTSTRFDYIIAFGSQYRSEAFLANNRDGYYEIGRCSSTAEPSQAGYEFTGQGIEDKYGDCDYPAVLKHFADVRKQGTKIISVTSVGGVFKAHDFIEHVDVAITTFYPGEYFAPGLAKVLSGSISPGGKLTQTIPKLEKEQIDGEDYLQSPIGRFNAGLKGKNCVKGSAKHGSDCLKGAKTTLTTNCYDGPLEACPPAYMWDHEGIVHLDMTKGWKHVIQYGYYSSNYSEGALVGYKYYEKYDMEPLFEFGFGLSYGKWSMDVDFSSCEQGTTSSQELPQSCKVTTKVILEDEEKKSEKTLRRLTDEKETQTDASEKVVSNVVQVYLGYKPTTESKMKNYPVKELAGFRKVWGSTDVTHNIDFNTAWDHVRRVWTTPCLRDNAPGTFTISVGYSSKDLHATTHTIACSMECPAVGLAWKIFAWMVIAIIVVFLVSVLYLVFGMCTRPSDSRSLAKSQLGTQMTGSFREASEKSNVVAPMPQP